MMESTQNATVRGARGGRRPGAGRPPSYREPQVRKTVTLPACYAEQLTTFVAGNLSDGIRLLVEFAYTPQRRTLVQPALPGSIAPPPPAGSGRGHAIWLAPDLDNPRRPADPFGLTTCPR